MSKCNKWKHKYCKPNCYRKCNVYKCNEVINCCDDLSNNERFVVANRGRGDVVLFEEEPETIITLQLLPNSEPMY